MDLLLEQHARGQRKRFLAQQEVGIGVVGEVEFWHVLKYCIADLEFRSSGVTESPSGSHNRDQGQSGKAESRGPVV